MIAFFVVRSQVYDPNFPMQPLEEPRIIKMYSSQGPATALAKRQAKWQRDTKNKNGNFEYSVFSQELDPSKADLIKCWNKDNV